MSWQDVADRTGLSRSRTYALLRYAPEAEIIRALDLLPAGELHHLAAALTHVSDLHQVARHIAADLQEHLDGRRPEPPPDQPAASAPTPTHP